MMFLKMLTYKSCFYLLLLTLHATISAKNNNGFLSRFVNYNNDYRIQNNLQSAESSSNYPRHYVQTGFKGSDIFIKDKVIKFQYKNESHIPMTFTNFDKALSAVVYAQNEIKLKKYLKYTHGLIEPGCALICCSYNKHSLHKDKCRKLLKSHIQNSVIMCSIIPKTVLYKYSSKETSTSSKVYLNISKIINRTSKNGNFSLCFHAFNSSASVLSNSTYVFQAIFKCSDISKIIKHQYNEEKMSQKSFRENSGFYILLLPKQHQRLSNYLENEIKIKQKTGFSPRIFSGYLLFDFPLDAKPKKCCINSVLHYNVFTKSDRAQKYSNEISVKKVNRNNDIHRIKRNTKSNTRNASEWNMMKHPFQFLHKLKKRDIVDDNSSIVESNNSNIVDNDNTSIDITATYPAVDNITTDNAENLNEYNNITFDISLDSIDPFKRRGEDGMIYIHGLFEMSVGECRVYPETGRFEYRAAQLAIQHVNEKNVIGGYHLEMYHNDTKCDSGVAVDAFFHSLYRQPTMSVILGTGSSEVTERLARVVSRWNVMQMSYGATSPALSDRENFPLFFRTIAPDSSHNAALLAFVLHHKWLTVAALHEQEDKHALPMTKLVTDLEQVNVTVKVTKGTSERDYKDHLQEVKDQDCRIVICSFSSSLFRKIFCQVYHLGMHGAEYAWIILGDTPDSWKVDASGTDCNDHQLISAIQGVISVGSHYEAVENGSAISEVKITDILHAIGYKRDYNATGFISQTYDAVWAIALAFRNVERGWRSMNSSSTLGKFTYDNHIMAQNFSSAMANLRFMGVSGPVSFYNSDRVGITAFHQKQGKNMKLAAIYNPDAGQLNFNCVGCSGLIWQGGSPPISRRIIIRRIATLDRRVFICVTALAALGVTLALTFLSFNLYYRKLKFIKLSSPNLNNFVVVGCVLVYIAVILLGLDHGTLVSDDHFPVICSARAFLLSGGFSLAFGCMFIKTYRVYHIFIRTNTGIVKTKLLHDQQLLGMVSVLLLVDCVLVTLWVTVDPMERQLTHLSLQVNKDERNVGYLYLREHCNSAHMAKWLGSLYIYKGLLLVVGCYMAWETRHVKVPALNDSQYIGMSVYNVVITSIIVVALANIIPADRYTLTFVLVSTLIFVSTTTTLCILFVPKIHTILINPEDAAVVATPGVKVECKTRRFALDELRESLYRAEVQNRALKRELQELDEEYNRLAEKAGLTPCSVRKPRLSEENQDDDSDEGLPPWLADYKDYSATGTDEVWYTSRPTIASAFNTIHSVALQLPSTSNNFQKGIPAQNKCDCSLNNSYYMPLRTTLTTIRSEEDVRIDDSPPVRTFLSDRALNKLKIPQTLEETAFDDVEDSPIPLRKLTPIVIEKHLRSEPKLFSEVHNQSNLAFSSFPSKSLNHVSNIGDSSSDLFKNTSAASDFTTAPLNDSTSFSTPPEDFMSSSNNGNESNKSARRSSENITSTSNYLTCEEDSAQDPYDILKSQTDVKVKELNSVVNTPENSTYCECSSNKSDTNALSGSISSVSGATVSDLSTDINDESQHESCNAIGESIDDSPTRCSSSITTVKNEKKDDSQSTSDTEIKNINITIGQNKSTIREVSPSDSSPENLVETVSETASIETSAKSNILFNAVTDNSAENPIRRNSKENTTDAPSDNNNAAEDSTRDVQIVNLRNQIFRLERELILLQLDHSDAVDL